MQPSFTLVKKGYDPIEVDEYINKLEATIREYKEKDNAIRDAFVNAQIAADNLVKEAEIKSQDMLHDASLKLNDMRNLLETQTKITKEFEDDYKALVNKYIKEFNSQDAFKIYSQINDLENKIVSLQGANLNS